MRTNGTAGSVPAREFRAVASTYGNLACVYVNDVFGEADRTVVSVFFEHGGERFKHFTFVLGRYSQVSQKFAILSGALQVLKAGDAGVVDLSDGMKAVYSPN